MVSILGYNGWKDVNCFDTAVNAQTFDNLTLYNTKFNGVNLVNNIDSLYHINIPSYNAGETLVNSKFENNIFSSMLKDDYKDINKIVISRYVDDEWTTIVELVLKEESWQDINLSILNKLYKDSAILSGILKYKIEYYKWINEASVVDETETKYLDIEYQLHSNFISDVDECFPMFMKVAVTQERNQNLQTIQTLAREYPIYIRNMKTNYNTGTFQAMLMTGDVIKELQTGKGFKLELQQKLLEYKNKLLDFLSNGKTKCIRLLQGEMFYAMITGNISVSWDNFGSGYICNVKFNWSEVDPKYQNGIEYKWWGDTNE